MQYDTKIHQIFNRAAAPVVQGHDCLALERFKEAADLDDYDEDDEEEYEIEDTPNYGGEEDAEK